MEPRRKHPVSTMVRSLGEGIETELFVAGVLTILVALAVVQAYLPAAALPGVGIAAFLALLVCGAGVRRAPAQERLRWFGLPRWGIAAFFAIVWIAAGRLIGTAQPERWLP